MGAPIIRKNLLITSGITMDMGSNPNIEFANCDNIDVKLHTFYDCNFWYGEEDEWYFETENVDINFLRNELHDKLMDWARVYCCTGPGTQGATRLRLPRINIRECFHDEFYFFRNHQSREEKLRIDNTLNSLKPKDLVKVLYSLVIHIKEILETFYGLN